MTMDSWSTVGYLRRKLMLSMFTNDPNQQHMLGTSYYEEA